MVILISVKCATEGCAAQIVFPVHFRGSFDDHWPTLAQVVRAMRDEGWRMEFNPGEVRCPRCIIAEDAPVVELESVEPAEWEGRHGSRSSRA